MRYLILGVFMFSALFGIAQQKCWQHILENQLRGDSLELNPRILRYQQWISETQFQNTSRADKIIFPIVFHVLSKKISSLEPFFYLDVSSLQARVHIISISGMGFNPTKQFLKTV